MERLLVGIRCFSSKVEQVPFYGKPRPPRSSHCTDRASSSSLSLSGGPLFGPVHRVALTLQQAAIALRDPTRADAVAAVGELTGVVALARLHEVMQGHPVGRSILQERPIVGKTTIPYDKLLKDASLMDKTDAEAVTFGQAYGAFLARHGFDPDERSSIKYLDDYPDLAYVMLRYRQSHDFFHTLTGLPPTVAGELGLKWLELLQTGLPLAAWSSTVGSLILPIHEQRILWNQYFPWAARMGARIPFGTLMNVYYEKEWETPLVKLRERLQLEPAPTIVEDGDQSIAKEF